MYTGSVESTPSVPAPAAEVKRVWEHDRLLRLWAVAPKLYDAALGQVSDHSIEECSGGGPVVHDGPIWYVDDIHKPCIWHALIQEIDR